MNFQTDFPIFVSPKSWLEGDAVEQCKQVMARPGALRGAGFPDLHPGHGVPVGAAFLFQDRIYPGLIGSDVGCGMTLWALDLAERKFKVERFIRLLGDAPETLLRRRGRELLKLAKPEVRDPAHLLGTVGGGNHFIEVLAIDEAGEPECFAALGIDRRSLLLLVHSGSRGYGEALWSRHAESCGDRGVEAESAAGRKYLAEHDRLLAWATFNRRLLGRTMLDLLGCDGREIVDSVHNAIAPAGDGRWLHRKGAAATRPGEVVPVAGSRGTASYLVYPDGDPARRLDSLAHGSGRKWTRQHTRARVKARFTPDELLHPAIGSWVVCPERDLLYEEAPEAYKPSSQVLADLVGCGLARIAARLRPVLNCKP